MVVGSEVEHNGDSQLFVNDVSVRPYSKQRMVSSVVPLSLETPGFKMFLPVFWLIRPKKNNTSIFPLTGEEKMSQSGRQEKFFFLPFQFVSKKSFKKAALFDY